MKFEKTTRWGVTHKFRCGELKGFVTANTEPGGAFELFVHLDTADEGVRGLARVLCLVVSVAVQNGVKLEKIVETLKFQRFEPAGMTGNGEIPMCASLADYLGKWLEREMLGRKKAQETQKESEK